MGNSSSLARNHELRLDSVSDAMDLIGSGVRRCVFTPDDVSPAFFDLETRLAGDIFQKLVNYRFEVAIVVPPDHGFGERVTELAREHASHPVIRMFPTEAEALSWSEQGAT